MTYRDLKSYQQALIICDYTVEFRKRYISTFSRTNDQMEQAARSGKQNIVEGCSVSKISPQNELKLINVARGSLEELLEDFKDFLRQRNLKIWDKDNPRAIEIRKLAYRSNKSDRTDRLDRSYRTDRTDTLSVAVGFDGTSKSGRSDMSDKTERLERMDRSDRASRLDKTYTTYKSYKSYESYRTYLENPESAANAMIVLINQTNYLLDQQIKAVRKQMEEKNISPMSHQQKLAHILAERKKKNEEFDKWLKSFRSKPE